MTRLPDAAAASSPPDLIEEWISYNANVVDPSPSSTPVRVHLYYDI